MNIERTCIKKHTIKEYCLSGVYLLSGVCLLGLAGILALLARSAAGFSDWYYETVYSLLVSTIGRLMGAAPFSVVEVLLYLLILWVIVSAGRVVWKLIRRENAGLRDFVGKVFVLVAALLFIYMACCGVNYYRTSFSESTGIHVDFYTSGELAAVCMDLTSEVNNLAGQVERDETGVMVYDSDMKAEAVNAMINLAEDYPELKGYYPKPKMLLVPQILSVQKVTGIYSPFTIEANCNGDMTDYNVPFTACHELSHLRGFMREEEANFIAWLACRESERVDFQYSGSLRGWISCMNVLYRSDYNAWAQIRVRLNPLVEADLSANRAYWAKFEGPVADAAQAVNDNYLKANGQSDGIQSYGRMSDLIVAYYLNSNTNTYSD